MFERVKILVCLVVLGLALSGFGFACSNDVSSTESAETREIADTVEFDPTISSVMEGVEVVKSVPPTVEGETVVQGLNRSGPVSGGVLAAPMTVCPPPDPAIDSATERFDFGSPSLVTEIHAGLTRIVDDPTFPFELELAETYDVDRQGLVYEFILRNDLKFSDGSALTGGDFKWSWERALEKSDSGSRARDVFGLIEGADAVILGKSEDLSGVEVIDDRTLRVRLTKPRADFPALLADSVAYVLKKDNVLSWGMEWTNSGSSIQGVFNSFNMPVGAGPFRLVAYRQSTSGGRCPIARNPHYWGEPAYLDGVWFRADLAEWERTDDGWWQTMPADPMVFVSEETDIETMGRTFVFEDDEDPEETGEVVYYDDTIEVEGAVEGLAAVVPTFIFAVLNAAAPPFDDIHFRRSALAYSQLTPFTQIVDEDARLITEELTTLEPLAEFIRYDEELASSELMSSKNASEGDKRQISVLQSLPFIVINVEGPSFVEWAEALNLTLHEDQFGVQTLDEFGGRHNNKYHVRIYRVAPAYPDPVTVLRALAAPFGKLNRAPEFVELDRMLADAATERDAVERHEKYLAIEEYAVEQALVIPIAVLESPIDYRYYDWVHDFDPPKYPGSVFHRVWLDETAPKRELPTP